MNRETADLTFYNILRGRNRGEGPVETVGEYRHRVEEAGHDWNIDPGVLWNIALGVLKGFRDLGLVEHFAWPPSDDTPLRLVEKPPMRLPWRRAPAATPGSEDSSER